MESAWRVPNQFTELEAPGTHGFNPPRCFTCFAITRLRLSNLLDLG